MAWYFPLIFSDIELNQNHLAVFDLFNAYWPTEEQIDL
jgi:hypothetical protein